LVLTSEVDNDSDISIEAILFSDNITVNTVFFTSCLDMYVNCCVPVSSLEVSVNGAGSGDARTPLYI